MSYAKSNGNYTVPAAESTLIEDSPRASPSRPNSLWGGKYTPRNRKMSSVQPQQSPNGLNKSIHSPRPRALDARIYCDTQSNGLAQRIDAYVKTTAAKSRPIANHAYSRPGDFPIVNLEKNEISIKPRQTSGTPFAKIGIGAPLQMNNQASIRSTIFRTGKNYGDAAPIMPEKNIGVAGTSGGSASSNGNSSTSRDDEPIVPTSGEYDATPTRSVLDELVEISRKRTHCDDLDGDFMKKQKADRSPIVSAQIVRQSSPPPNQITKRGRDRTSPSYYNNAAETQKKRYRNNDILSSLSSSLHLSSPKSARIVLDFDSDGDKSNATIAQVKNAVKARPALRSDVIERNGNKTLSTASNHHEIAPSSRSHSSVQREQLPKVQKLTLFNKIYEPTVGTTSNGKHGDDQSDLDESTSADYEDNRISFVKPKTKTSTVFKVDKNGTGTNAKLKIMLNYLNESESRDEVDNGAKADKTKVNEVPIVIASTTASLNVGEETTVTYSTATTTSVLSLPSAVTMPEPRKNGVGITAPTTAETIKSSPIATIATSNANNVNTLPESTALPTFGEPAKPTTAAPTMASTTNSVTSIESVPRLGGFSFAATMTTTSPLTAAKSDANPNDLQTTKPPENAIPTAMPLPPFSFGKPVTPTTTVSTPTATAAPSSDAAKSIPVATGFGFGASNASKGTSLNTSIDVTATTATTLPTTSAQSMASFSFGQNLNGSTTSTAVPFGTSSFSFTATTTAASTSIATSTASTTTPAAPTFNFAAAKSTGTGTSFGTSSPAAAPAITTPSVTGNTFSFGAASTVTVPSAAPLQFGATSTATRNVFGAKIESSGTSTLTTQPSIYGTPAVTPTTTATISSFGVQNTSFNSIATTTISSFGAPFNRGIITTTTTAPPAFSASTTTTSPIFGAFGANTNSAMPALAAAQTPATNLFGSATAAAPQKSEPVFGSQSAAAAAPAFGTSSFGATNNVFGNPSQTQNTGSAGLFGGNNTNATPSFAAPSSFGASATPSAQSAPTTGLFAFGSAAVPTTTASSGGIFDGTPTNSSFTFGSTISPAANNSTFATPTINQQNTPFAFNAGTNSTTTAPSAFGNSGSAFNFASKAASPFGAPAPVAPTDTKSPFSFNAASNANASSVSAFNSAPPNVSPFGNNNIGSTAANASFSFGASTNEAPKPFSFGSTTTDNSNINSNMFGASASAPTPFAFGAPPATAIVSPPANAFQFNAQQPTAANLFSIGPGNPSKNRPIRQATRRINK